MSEPSGPGGLEFAEEETGSIRIGEVPAAPAGIGTVPVPGGTVYVDPSRPDVPPAAVVADPDEAAAAVEVLYGADAAEALVADDLPRSVPVAMTGAAARLTRLGILRWLRASSPFPLDQGLLAFETAVAAAACGDVLDDEDVPAPTLEQLGDVIIEMAAVVRERGNDSLPPGLTGLLEDALDSLVLGLEPDDPLAVSAGDAAELRAAMSALAIDRIDWSRWEELVGTTRPMAAADLGAGGDSGHGTASVDWNRVPANVLDPGEETISWQTRPLGTGRLRVEVSVRGRADTGGFRLADWLAPTAGGAAAELHELSDRAGRADLRFRLYAPGLGIPVATGALARSDDRMRWQGSAEIPERALADGELFVDVHSAGTSAPRRGHAAAAEARRWAVRGVGLLRLSAAGSATGEQIRGPLERAYRLFAAAGSTGDPVASDRLRQAAARCRSLQIAHLERAGEHESAERLRRGSAGRPPSGDPVVPELASPAWAPTVTERALLEGAAADG